MLRFAQMKAGGDAVETLCIMRANPGGAGKWSGKTRISKPKGDLNE